MKQGQFANTSCAVDVVLHERVTPQETFEKLNECQKIYKLGLKFAFSRDLHPLPVLSTGTGIEIDEEPLPSLPRNIRYSPASQKIRSELPLSFHGSVKQFHQQDVGT